MRTVYLALTIALAACTNIPPGPPPTGSLSGTISGTNVGALAGVTVTATAQVPNAPVADSTTTSNNGAYSLTGLPIGSGVIALSGIPAGCQPSAAVNYSIAANANTVVNIQLSCTQVPQTGTIVGTVASSLGGGIANAQVIVTPSGGAALPAATTDLNGNYAVTGVAVGGGSVAITGVPANCTAPAPQPYSNL